MNGINSHVAHCAPSRGLQPADTYPSAFFPAPARPPAAPQTHRAGSPRRVLNPHLCAPSTECMGSGCRRPSQLGTRWGVLGAGRRVHESLTLARREGRGWAQPHTSWVGTLCFPLSLGPSFPPSTQGDGLSSRSTTTWSSL